MLFATGLLIAAPLAGWAVLTGILCRQLWLSTRGPAGQTVMEVFAGDALFSFFSLVATNYTRRH